jgi:osomolarity two-component system sensor histidine kinase SLN1
MNYFLSKPIRRPQLKKVLKEYCAPIPEENEEPTTPLDERRGSAANTTIVMVNGASADAVCPGSANGKAEEGAGSKEPEADHVEVKKDGV